MHRFGFVGFLAGAFARQAHRHAITEIHVQHIPPSGKVIAVQYCCLVPEEIQDFQIARISGAQPDRSEEHTSELQSLMRNSYAVFCLKKKIKKINMIKYLTSSTQYTTMKLPHSDRTTKT